MKFRLIQATNNDFDFLKLLHQATMKEHVEQIWGWDDVQQDKIFLERFDPENTQIIYVANQKAGMLSVFYREKEIFIGNILLRPEFQNKGIGKEIIENIILESHKKKIPVTLTVLVTNRAKQFYQRLGFKVIGKDDVRYFMKRNI